MDELETEYAGKVKLVKMNVDEQTVIVYRMNVMSIPTSVIFKDGKPLNGMLGAQPKDAVK